MLQMGFFQEELQESLINQKYDEVMATYLLLDYRNSEVFVNAHTYITLAKSDHIILLCCQLFYVLMHHANLQLDEGINLTLKPRPGSDLTNSNAPSPPHKVQRSVSSTQKPVRRSTDQGAFVWKVCESIPLVNTKPLILIFCCFCPQVRTQKGLREKTSLALRILGGKVQIALPKFHPVPSSPANAKRAPHPLL